jgi:hypothetical protein
MKKPKMGGYTRAVSGQRFGNPVPKATETKAKTVQQHGNGVFRGPRRGH